MPARKKTQRGATKKKAGEKSASAVEDAAVKKGRKSEGAARAPREKKTTTSKPEREKKTAAAGKPESEMPAFDGKRRAEMTKPEIDAMNAYFMRKNRMRHALEKNVDDFASKLGGSVLAVVETGGGALRKGTRYTMVSGRFSGEFLDASARTVVERGDLTWDEASEVTVSELLIALSEGALHTSSVSESAYEARRRKQKLAKKEKMEKARARAKARAEARAEAKTAAKANATTKAAPEGKAKAVVQDAEMSAASSDTLSCEDEDEDEDVDVTD